MGLEAEHVTTVHHALQDCHLRGGGNVLVAGFWSRSEGQQRKSKETRTLQDYGCESAVEYCRTEDSLQQ